MAYNFRLMAENCTTYNTDFASPAKHLCADILFQIHFVWSKPPLLFAYMYSIMFVCLSGSHANSLQFGASVITASTSPGTEVDFRVQKLIAIALVSVVCLIQAYSREVILRLNDLIAWYKVLVLSFMAVAGFVSLAGVRTQLASESSAAPYGMQNLENSFSGTTSNPYAWGMALLVVGRSYLGYENANLVCFSRLAVRSEY
jgi:amino acid transporter